MEVTNTLAAKIFSLYAPCKVRNFYSEGKFRDEGFNYRQLDYIPVLGIQGYRLILKPLEQITDEHAIEVAKLLVQHGKVDLDELTFFITDRTDEKVLLKVEGIKYHLYYNGTILATSRLAKEDPATYLPIYNTHQVTDYLRSKSYHVPYLNIDLFESGIAIKAPIN